MKELREVRKFVGLSRGLGSIGAGLLRFGVEYTGRIPAYRH